MQGSSSPGISLKIQFIVPRLILTVNLPQVLYTWVMYKCPGMGPGEEASISDKVALCLPSLVPLGLHLPTEFLFKIHIPRWGGGDV